MSSATMKEREDRLYKLRMATSILQIASETEPNQIRETRIASLRDMADGNRTPTTEDIQAYLTVIRKIYPELKHP